MPLPNVNVLTEKLASMPDNALVQYAQMNQNDPYVMALAVSEKNRRGAMRQAAVARQAGMRLDQPTVAEQELAEMAPASAGLSTLPAPTMDNMGEGMAGGGITGYARGGKIDVQGDLAKALRAEGISDPRTISFIQSLYAQESSSGKNTKTSNRGARGGLQVTPIAFRDVNQDDLDYSDPLDQLRAGIRYAQKGIQAADGDLRLAATYYYGGPSGMRAAMEGVPKVDPENPKAPNTLEYADEVISRMGADTPAPDSAPDSAPAQSQASSMTPSGIPTPMGESYTPEQLEGVYQQPDTRPGDYGLFQNAIGNIENIGAGLYNMAAIPAAAIPALVDKATGAEDFEAAYRQRLQQMQVSPMTEAGQAQQRAIAQALDAAKLPAVMPGMAGAPRVSRAGLSGLNAEAQAARAAAAGAADKTSALRLTPPPKAGIGALTPEAQQTRAAAELARRERGMSTDVDAAAAAASRATQAETVAREASGAARRDLRTGMGAEAAPIAAGAMAAGDPTRPSAAKTPVAPTVPPVDLAKDLLDKEEKKKLVDAAKKEIPAKKRKGFSNEDMLMLGLNLLASPSPRFTEALGTAGLATLKARLDRQALEREAATDEQGQELRSAQADYYRAQSEYMRGAKKQNDALKLVQDEMEAWAKANPALAMDETKITQQRNAITRNVFNTMGLPVPSTIGGSTGLTGFKVLGSRPN